MKTGPVIVGAVLALYLGFEAYTIKRAGQRIKPDYIHNMLVEARTATERCDSEAALKAHSLEQPIDSKALWLNNMLTPAAMLSIK